MTPRRKALLDYHRDVAAFAVTRQDDVFVILDLDDPAGFEIASHFQTDCAQKRDAIRASGSLPAFTLVMSMKEAGQLVLHGWPDAKPLAPAPDGLVAVILISEGRYLSAFSPRS